VTLQNRITLPVFMLAINFVVTQAIMVKQQNQDVNQTGVSERHTEWYCYTYRSMIPSICLRTSCALFSVRTCTKFS